MKSLFPVFAILLGIIFNPAYIFAFLIKYLLMFILLFPFLTLKVNKFYTNAFWIIIANILIAFTFYIIISPFNSELAFIAFITAITPTANAAPAMMSFLKGNVEYVTFSVILTNSVIAFTIPFVIPLLVTQDYPIETQDVFLSVLYLFATPFIIAQALRILSPKLRNSIIKYKNYSFYVWNILLFLATAKATHFILHEANTSPKMIFVIAAISLVICISNFMIGSFIGGKYFAREASQSLGQKNTMFTVWLSLSFLHPIVALGPMFYLLYHNLYNSYQLVRVAHR